jgi:hypothetical protein
MQRIGNLLFLINGIALNHFVKKLLNLP